ncbi:reverse transcriptase [Gossypium australe]|uniref:Reverse transcriptase n=1 Tax=Gossypium australe TaxID=47621 RepID=A0A5B6X3T0_9ROSI|nr:reverse transcriptase [Gossypium australe]
MEVIARSYFQNLFSAGGQSTAYGEIYKGGIHSVLSEIGPTKAPSEDGFPALFYQKCWHVIGEDVISFCLRLLNGGMDVSSINTIHIVLISKIANPSNITHFWPISLCNVLYKLMANVIANRFREVLEKCIDVAQSTFVLGRLTSDNVLLAYEILHTLN